MKKDAHKNPQPAPMVVEKRCEAAVSVAVADQVLLVNKQACGTAESEHIPGAQAHGFGRSVHDDQKQNLECCDSGVFTRRYETGAE